MTSDFRAPDLPPERDAEIRAERAREQMDRRRQQLTEIARLALRALGGDGVRPEWGADCRDAIVRKLEGKVPGGSVWDFFRALDNRKAEVMQVALTDMFLGPAIDDVRSIIGEGRARKRKKHAKRTEVRR